MPLPERPRGRGDVVRRDLGTEAMLYDPVADRIVRLNRTALRIWDLCDGARDLAEIAGALAADFAAGPGADVRADVGAAVGAFAAAGLLS
jgi:hypothetical protein